MLKRNMAILIAGAMLGAQINVAAAGQGAYATSADESGMGMGSTLPAVTDYVEGRAAAIQKEGAVLRGDSYPPKPAYSKPLPVQAKYLEERAAQRRVAAQRSDAFAQSAEDLVWKMPQAQMSYFEQRAAAQQAGNSEVSASSGE